MSEVIGCLVEIVVFTIMGCIVNASALLKYVMLILMILVYCGDCFNNMEKKYLKMNRALFNEVKFRIKDLEEVTSLPASLQENFAFKAQELNQQASYECPDNVAINPANHWMINDLVLFVDNEDTPRIPVQLFHDVIQIRVAGVPGPIYRGHIEAFQQLSKIVLFVVFVFLVVLSFGSVHKISATNQTLATLVGGFLPRMLRMFLAPPRPEVELGTVYFKSKMDEIIKNFCQYWPIYDLPFEVVKDEDNDQNAEAKKDLNNSSDLQIIVPRYNSLKPINLNSCASSINISIDAAGGRVQIGGIQTVPECRDRCDDDDGGTTKQKSAEESEEDEVIAIRIPSKWELSK